VEWKSDGEEWRRDKWAEPTMFHLFLRAPEHPHLAYNTLCGGLSIIQSLLFLTC
jgi:hypothetical protein